VFGRIIAVIDGADASRPAVETAAALAGQFGCELVGVFVVDGGWPDYIGNDWQSAAGARQGFLDYIRSEQEAQAEAARAQFDAATQRLASARFEVMAGDPTTVVTELAGDDATGLLITSKRVFQVSGRPSLKGLARALSTKATRPLLLLP
jgi:nucleotide-binding universal stress UspA family protein